MTESAEQLWARALEDTTRVDPDRVVRIPLDGGPDLDRGRYAQHYPPNSRASTVWGLSDGERARIDTDLTVHRIAHVSDVEHAPALLGLLRSQLRHVESWTAQSGAYYLTDAINASLDPAYGKLRGGGVVYLALPMIRDATAAGAQLLRRVYGPQPGLYYDRHFGPLYRTDRAPGSLDDLPQRTVVFAAIHGEAFEGWAKAPTALHSVLQNAHPDAPAWWDTLKGDVLFRHLSGSAPAWKPDADELVEWAENPAVAWRPLEALLDRALDHGLYVLNR